jgi:hypothetical protein
MDVFELSDDDFAALTAPERTDTWLAAFDSGLRRAGVSDEAVKLRHTADRALLEGTRVSAELRHARARNCSTTIPSIGSRKTGNERRI